MISKIISGGQTGTDVAALRAAKSLGVATGGTMPRGFLTLSGKRPEYKAMYGMVESYSPGYAFRTASNVRDADFTLCIALDFTSTGERCTSRAIVDTGRPSFRVQLVRNHVLLAPLDDDWMQYAIDAIEACSCRWGRDIVLNVCGNAEQHAAGIEFTAEKMIMALKYVIEFELGEWFMDGETAMERRWSRNLHAARVYDSGNDANGMRWKWNALSPDSFRAEHGGAETKAGAMRRADDVLNRWCYPAEQDEPRRLCSWNLCGAPAVCRVLVRRFDGCRQPGGHRCEKHAKSSEPGWPIDSRHPVDAEFVIAGLGNQ